MKDSELSLAAQEAADNARHVEMLVGGALWCRVDSPVAR